MNVLPYRTRANGKISRCSRVQVPLTAGFRQHTVLPASRNVLLSQGKNGNEVTLASTNGSTSSNGASYNGNGSKPYTTALLEPAAATMAGSKEVLEQESAPIAALATAAAATATNGASRSTYNGNGNGNGATQADSIDSKASDPEIEGDMNPCEAGQLEACANIRIAEKERSVGAESAQATTTTTSTRPAVGGSPYLQAGGKWASFKQYSVVQRTFQIYSFALKFAFRYWRLNKSGSYKRMPGGMTPENISARKTTLAIWLREQLIRLGPTFIKIGQQFSTRVDVLAPEFIKELEQLQDNVPGFDAMAVSETMKRNYGGRRAEDVFDEFDYTPVAAASLGQVHLAKLKGQRVVVKVQRPGLKDLFDIDLKNVRVLAQWLQRLDPKTDGAARDWVAIYDECSRILYEEINYKQEALYAKEFADNFRDTPWVKVPEIYWDYSTSEVLVMEYVPGVKINNAAAIDEMGLDRSRLARLSVESYLQQLLRHGLFHADPHPGNVAVDAVDGGRLIYYDFGMMGRIQTDIRKGLLELFYGVYQKDSDKCLDSLVTMGVLVPGGDRTALIRTCDFFLKSFQERLDQQREEAKANPNINDTFKPKRTKDEAKAKRKQILSSIGEDLLLAAADQPFRFPAAFTFVVRSFTVLDGIGKALNPRFDISEIAAPYARELLLEGRPQFAKVQEDFSKRWKRQSRAVKGLFNAPLQIEDATNILMRLEKGDFKPRVRALETERALQRMQQWQVVMACLVGASTFANMGTVLKVSALALHSTLSFVAASVFAVLTLFNFFKLKKLEQKELQLLGQG